MRARYTAVAQILHWVIATLILLNLVLGWRMGTLHGLARFEVFQLHKSFGITVLLLSVLRLGWRLGHRAPPFPPGMGRRAARAARLVHVAFYALMFLLPLSGWALVSASAQNVPTLLFHVLPWPYMPGVHALPTASRHAVRAAADGAHLRLVWVAMALVALHVAGAIRHEFEPHARVLVRMRPSAGVAGVTAVPVLAAVVAAVMALTVSGTAPAVGALAPAPPAGWVVDAPESTLGFVVAVNGEQVTGHFERWTAAIDFDAAHLASSHVVVRIDTGSARTGDDSRDGMLPDADWFDVGAFPQARFEATRFEDLGAGHYAADGTLTIRNHAVPLQLPFALAPAPGGETRMTASVPIDRRAFGVGQGQFAGTDSVAADVTLRIVLVAKPRGVAP